MNIQSSEKYGKLTVVREAGKTKHGMQYLCKCECGNMKVIYGYNLKRGFTKSCGACRYNTYRPGNDENTIIGTFPNGVEFYFDKSDLERVKKYTWYLQGSPRKWTIGNRHRLTLHRYLLGDKKGYEIDHIDLNRLNNRRSNLRYCTHRQNQCNHRLQNNNTSGVAGVRFNKKRSKHVARIKHFGQEIHLGYYETLFEAMQARNVAMKLLFGEFARLNKVCEAPKHIKDYVIEKCTPYIGQTVSR